MCGAGDAVLDRWYAGTVGAPELEFETKQKNFPVEGSMRVRYMYVHTVEMSGACNNDALQESVCNSAEWCCVVCDRYVGASRGRNSRWGIKKKRKLALVFKMGGVCVL